MSRVIDGSYRIADCLIHADLGGVFRAEPLDGSKAVTIALLEAHEPALVARFEKQYETVQEI
ncbi:MAG: hypothetical protein AAGF12_32075, partial [Myxococcota bacterium]